MSHRSQKSLFKVSSDLGQNLILSSAPLPNMQATLQGIVLPLSFQEQWHMTKKPSFPQFFINLF